jgi:transposase-like protein
MAYIDRTGGFSMSDLNLTNAIFHDEEKARLYLEAQRWPDGVTCPFCNERHAVKTLHSEAHGPGWYSCNDCRKLFTVRVGGVMERSHIPLAKWALVFHMMAASKKGVSAKQVQRQLGFKSYKTAWFMCHRIREAMKPDANAGPVGGEGKIVESDETYVGGKAQTAHKSKPIPKKHAVIALVERGGEVRAKHVASVSMKTLRETLTKVASLESTLMTDDSPVSRKLRKEFKAHGVVVHSKGEYVKKDGVTHTQTIESFFAILKRGINGSFHSVSEQHLQRYVDEFAFRWNARSSLGIEDAERAARMVKGASGKRLTYRRPNEEAS